MNCEQMNDLLWAFLDGELTAQEEEQMHAHLEQCADCRALLEQLQTLRTSFSDLEEISAPEGFAEKVMDRIKVSYVADGKVAEIFAAYGEEICGEVLADTLVAGAVSGYEKEWNINGEKVTLGVERVS